MRAIDQNTVVRMFERSIAPIGFSTKRVNRNQRLLTIIVLKISQEKFPKNDVTAVSSLQCDPFKQGIKDPVQI